MQNASKPFKSILSDIAEDTPTQTALTLQHTAATVGFDWPCVEEVFAKVDEEIEELRVAYHTQAPRDDLFEELGDLLFVIINLARHFNFSSEDALSKANQKFIRRFQYIEKMAHQRNQSLQNLSLEEMEVYWNDAKRYSDGL